jgi:hypothetical protein
MCHSISTMRWCRDFMPASRALETWIWLESTVSAQHSWWPARGWLCCFSPRSTAARCFSGLLVAGLVTAMLFYHSNGYTQYNVQRYMLDWLPAALVMLGYAVQRHSTPLFPMAVLWGMGLNAVTIATMVMVRQGIG